ncbi:acyltransferase domain-containing protein [Massilia sp. R2A-15]|uniref:acyltransferase domain-containing protein n=1 Tax=Massilia sp. R2A-15 TaxID=3064278 RepID=UPI002733DB7C|nr:acyltransferase domain-containing protein [Massilia sp. R2A-15]WLI91217.1 acyltransferase domain-containing protein [Massilia sp. R2A-15]
MSVRLLLLCPGQGGQSPGMFDLARTDARAAALISNLGQFDRDTLFENRIAQPSVVGATLAMWEALKTRLPAPSLVAGYSVGELSAYGVAGALAPVDAVRIAARRAQLMDASVTAPQALVAISAMPVDRVRTIAGANGFTVAIVTGHDSCIAGGLENTLAGLEHVIAQAGARLQRLPVGIASHTPLMARAVAPFIAELETADFAPQACPVLSGICAETIVGKSRAIEALSRQLVETIVWDACMDVAIEAGINIALELGPGAALARMLQARHPQIPCRSVADFRSIDGIVSWFERVS